MNQITRTVGFLFNSNWLGCLQVIPGSQKQGTLPQAADGSIAPEWCQGKEWVPVVCKPGDSLIFGSYIAHKSDANRSARARRAYYFTFNDSASGEMRSEYYSEKRLKFPPPAERKPGVDYAEGAKIYNLATPIV